MFKNKKAGFTLIELLVVVAIIGLLSAIVLAALQSARSKGNDGAVKSNLRSAVSEGEVFFNTNTASVNTYTSVCTNGVVGGAKGVGELVKAAASASGLSSYTINGTGTLITASCNDSAAAWAAEVPLKSSSGVWCVDSTGKSLEEAGSIGATTSCL